MARETAEKLGYQPIARFVGFQVAGVPSEIMGIGPVEAVPRVLKRTGLTIDDMDVIEINEAFASQAIACIRTLGLPEEKVNPNGGAMALGHPLGATGAVLTSKVLSYLERKGGRHGLITMCIGGGMGAAGIVEME
jgi:acetyl-CoA acyltransferase